MILVACEESQAVTIEFRNLGYEAYSCDILPCSGGHPEWHLQQDVVPLLKEQWDLVVAFPPCTHLASSGARWFNQKRKDGRQSEAINFFMEFVNCNCDRVAIENPVGIMSSVYRKPDQIIQPWQFGHSASKKTCLWLRGIPVLKETKIISPKGYTSPENYVDGMTSVCIDNFCFVTNIKPQPKPIWDNQTASGQNKLSPSPERAKLRSKTYTGIAKAMAQQWGNLLKINDNFRFADEIAE